MKDSFPIVILERDNLFYCLIKEFSILECGADLTKTYERAKLKKTEALQQFKQANLEYFLYYSKPVDERKKRVGFSLNFVLLTLMLMVPLTSVTLPICRMLKQISKIFEKPVDLVIDFGKRLDAMSPEKQQKLKKSIQALMAHFQQEDEGGKSELFSQERF